MKSLYIAIIIGFLADLAVGDPHSLPHPVSLIGKLISTAEKALRGLFPKSPSGERAAGAVLWLFVCAVSFFVPYFVLFLCRSVSIYLSVAAEGIMCWQILAARSLHDESMKVYSALASDDVPLARRAVSMIVGRDTSALDKDGVARAAVETVAENTADGVISPLFFLVLGGAPLGFLYKAVNTMDSMLGYTDEPYKNIGLVPARADDVFNFIPARLSALLMLCGGALLKMDIKNGLRIFRRDRYRHASPNSAQCESVCAGLLGVRLGGDAVYHGVVHKKPYIGDPLRGIEADDIPRACRLMYAAELLAIVLISAAFVICVILPR